LNEKRSWQLAAEINDYRIENWQSLSIKKGQTLKFVKKSSGNIAYLSVKGGFEVKKWLKSASTNLQANIGGWHGRKLEKDDRLSFNENSKIGCDSKKLSQTIMPQYSKNPTIRMVAGEEFDRITGLSENIFLCEEFTITQNSNRMGFRLEGKPLYSLDNAELVSSAVDFGTIQLLPDGQMIILMADHQTTGGYPRIGHVISADLTILAQLGANERVNFQLISIDEAEAIALKFERDLKFLKTGIKFHSKLK
jgi:antagonist of KipI